VTTSRYGTIRLDAPFGVLWLDFEVVVFPDDRHELEVDGDRPSTRTGGRPKPFITYTYRAAGSARAWAASVTKGGVRWHVSGRFS
jgi:hypothetical protein